MGVRALPDKILRLKNIGKKIQHKDSTLEILKDINLTIHPGEFVSIVGTRGSGKSALLRMLVGLDAGFSGEISQGGKPFTGPELKRAIVFKDTRLLPWLSVADNIAFALQNTAIPQYEKQQRVQHYVDLSGLNGFEKSWPCRLPLGMGQRVAIARALVNHPELLVLDDPFSALDTMVRVHLQNTLQEIWRKEKITTILVTHDVDEAVFLADRIVVMEPNPGRIKRVLVGPEAYPRDRTSVAFNTVKRLALADINGDDSGQSQTFVDFNRLAKVRLSW